MCGICGFFHKDINRPLPKDVLSRMVEAMEHRGPDEKGVFFSVGGAFGQRRLNIIDFAGGKQPMRSGDNESVLVANGEIYNYKELKNDYLGSVKFESSSDTEVLLYLLKIKGVDAIPLLNGMFAFAFWDIKNKKVILARDPVGQKPLFYYFGSSDFVFASELSSLVCNYNVPVDLDYEALARYLLFEAYPHPYSPLRGVRKLSPGHFMVVDLVTWEFKQYRYWNCKPQPHSGPGESEKHCVDDFREKITSAVERHLRSDVEVGVFLSSGLDSASLLKAISAASRGEALRTFTIKHELSSFDESFYARQIAKAFGTRHHEKTLKAEEFISDAKYLLSKIDEPIANPGLLSVYEVAKVSREFVKVAISGNGGDEFFGGYAPFRALGGYRAAHLLFPNFIVEALTWFASLPKAGHGYMNNLFKVQRFLRGVPFPPPEFLMQWIGSFNRNEIMKILNKDMENKALEINHNGVFDLYQELHNEYARLESKDLFLVLLHLFQQFYLPLCTCNYSDKATMRVSQELRSPFLDTEMMAFANRLASPMKYRNGTTKYILRRYLKGDAPDSIVNKPKQGFAIPIASWLATSLRPWVNEILDPQQLKKDAIFDAYQVRKMWDEHQKKKANHAKSLWTVIVFQNWFHSSYKNWSLR